MTMNTEQFVQTRETFMKTIRGSVRAMMSALAFAKSMMQGKDEAEAAAEALNALCDEFAALPKEKRAESGLRDAIRKVYKDMSTAVAHERRNLKREVNDPATEIEKLHAKFPYRIVCIKGVYAAVTHAEFDAERPAAAERTANGDANDDGESGDVSQPKNADKAAQAIAALEAALAEMTADRNQWRDRAVAAESTLADLRKPAAAKPAKASKTAKPAKQAKAG